MRTRPNASAASPVSQSGNWNLSDATSPKTEPTTSQTTAEWKKSSAGRRVLSSAATRSTIATSGGGLSRYTAAALTPSSLPPRPSALHVTSSSSKTRNAASDASVNSPFSAAQTNAAHAITAPAAQIAMM